VLYTDVSGGDWVTDLSGESWHAEVHAVIAVVGRSVVESLGVGHGSEVGWTVEEVEDVVVRNVTSRWLRTFVVGQGRGAIEDTILVLSDVVHPPVQTCSPVASKTGDQSRIVGSVDDRVRDQQVDERKGVNSRVARVGVDDRFTGISDWADVSIVSQVFRDKSRLTRLSNEQSIGSDISRSKLEAKRSLGRWVCALRCLSRDNSGSSKSRQRQTCREDHFRLFYVVVSSTTTKVKKSEGENMMKFKKHPKQVRPSVYQRNRIGADVVLEITEFERLER